jgi:hypothetical protein
MRLKFEQGNRQGARTEFILGSVKVLLDPPIPRRSPKRLRPGDNLQKVSDLSKEKKGENRENVRICGFDESIAQ